MESHVPGFGKVEEAPVVKTTTKVYPPAPEILYLTEEEKFKDEQGNAIDIEVRGERNYDKVWFKARDVEKMMGIVDVSSTITSSTSSYDCGVHYQTFDLFQCPHNVRALEQNKKGNQTAMFLSYWGLVKMLFGRRHPIALQFQRWAIQKLFAIQMGTQEAKNELAADVLGVTPKALKAVLNTNVNAMPVVYLFQLGKAKDLREVFDIPSSFKDDDIVVKYGLTTDLKRRTTEHELAFKKVSKNEINMTMKYHVYIDPFYLSQAENDIEHYFDGAMWRLKHPKFTELAAFPEYMLNSIVLKEFKRLGSAYAGKLQDLQLQLSNEQKINEQLKKQIDSQEQHHRETVEYMERTNKEKEALLVKMSKDKEELYQKAMQSKDEMLELYKAMFKGKMN